MSSMSSLLRIRWRTLLLGLILLVVAWSGYSYWSDYRDQAARKAREMLAPPAGALCTVTCTPEINQIHNGRFVQMNDHWLVLDSMTKDAPQLWIPLEHIALLKVGGE